MLNKLKSQLLLLSTLPAIIITLGLIIYMNVTRVQDFDHYLQLRGENSSSQLATLARTQLQQGNKTVLQALATNSLEENGVRSVNIYAANGKLIVHSGPRTHLRKRLNSELQQITEIQTFSDDQSIIFIAAMNTGTYTSDWYEADDGAPAQETLGWVSVEYNRDRFTLSRYNSLLSQNSIFILCLIFAAICGYYIQKRFNQDLQQISNTLKQLRDGQNLHHVTHCKNQELQNISLSIHKLNMLYQSELSELKHSMELTTSDLKETIETIEIQNIELGIAQKQAVQASQIKSEFLANTRHEIRTPLNGIIGFAKILKRTALNTQQQEYLDTILLSSDGLLTIINDILDFSKIEAGKLELEPSPCHLRQVYEEVVSLFAPLAYEKQLDINLLFYQDVPCYLHLDAVRLKQVLSNIISNAIKFTHKGEIVIRVSLDAIEEANNGNKVAIKTSVSDTGIGMTAQQQKGLFQAFSQSNASISREYGGTGLGLAISRKLIEKFNGDISVESALEKGSSFNFNIWAEQQAHTPIVEAAAFSNKSVVIMSQNPHTAMAIENLLHMWGLKTFTITANADSDQALQELQTHYHLDSMIYAPDYHHNNKIHLSAYQALATKYQLKLLALTATPGFHNDNDSYTVGHQPVTETSLYRSLSQHFSTPAPQPLPLAPEKILLGLEILGVDDNAANLKLLGILLQDLGATFSTASDGEQAIKAAEAKRFDAIFMDLQMPIINGFEASKHIRQQQSTPIIALTAHALADEKQRLLDIGVNAYLSKPINESMLIETLAKVCQLESRSPFAHAKASNEHSIVSLRNCLTLANNKIDLASDMFSMLMQRLNDDIGTIQQAHKTRDKEVLLDEVHKLNGACSYTGVPQLKAACMALETQLKAKDNTLECSELLSLLDALYSQSDKVLKWHENNNIESLLAAETPAL